MVGSTAAGSAIVAVSSAVVIFALEGSVVRGSVVEGSAVDVCSALDCSAELLVGCGLFELELVE